ncbi:hypothetical protein RB614_35930 [Phytohabitans sp. ZYX-F-186]|uniref:AAA+ ATPase domain-containing protein n=1 Tax=Phytohabitans maris TaxID=3071409 RepID=A0ABU0ZS92_9ACTN|nr:hypothetical protein [Phytohabitans sp. ZYX-F-186]MDQ7909901.1 hypothetical protein [Phytohabitans sp. ZYX-F-186]
MDRVRGVTWQERVRAATAPVVACAHGQPAAAAPVLGSAVLLAERSFLTCLHVVRGRASVDLLVDGERIHASVRGPADDTVDIAALDLDAALPGVVPLRVSPRRRPPAAVAIFGYPAADGTNAGVWLRFRHAGPTNDNDVQVSTLDRRGSWKGHSGAPVIDVRDGHVVGLLRSGEREGTFDRYVPLDLAGGAGFVLKQGWMYMGVADGWAGRDPADTVLAAQAAPHSRLGLLDRIAAFLTEGAAAAPLLVTGPPGAGKSWLLRQSAARLSDVEALLFFDARQATYAHFAEAAAELLGSGAEQLPASLPPGTRRSALLVDSLDEAATPAHARNIAYGLRRLAEVPGLAVVAGARRQPPTGVVQLPQLLGVAEREADLVVDLGSAAHSAAGDMVPPVADLLAAGGDGTVGALLAPRREVRTRLAAVVARRSGGNYLIATTAARLLAGRPADDLATLDPAGDGFDPALIPASLGDTIDLAIEGHCARSGADEFAVRGWLAALAYGQGSGLDWDRWVRFRPCARLPDDPGGRGPPAGMGDLRAAHGRSGRSERALPQHDGPAAARGAAGARGPEPDRRGADAGRRGERWLEPGRGVRAPVRRRARAGRRGTGGPAPHAGLRGGGRGGAAALRRRGFRLRRAGERGAGGAAADNRTGRGPGARGAAGVGGIACRRRPGVRRGRGLRGTGALGEHGGAAAPVAAPTPRGRGLDRRAYCPAPGRAPVRTDRDGLRGRAGTGLGRGGDDPGR